MTEVAPLPSGAVLLHVGMPKSGTTAVQRAAALQREALLAHGVRYPGDRYNHSIPSFAVAGRRRSATLVKQRKATPESHWWDLVREVQDETERRVLISHEFFAEHPEDVCRRVVADLDRDVHVVFTMRNQASLLASTWQQYLKSGASWTFDEWLAMVLGDRTGKTHSFDRRTDLAGVVDKWARIVGPDKVTVIVLDRAEPQRLTDTFEDLLGLPRDLIGGVDLSGDYANRSFVASEVELLRQLNIALQETTSMSWPEFRELYRNGGILRLLSREPDADEPSIVIPQWAVDEMTARARTQVELLGAAGVNVIGDLDVLAQPVRGAPESPALPGDVPVGAARAMALGILERSLRLLAEQEASQSPLPHGGPSKRATRAAARTSGSVRAQVRASTRATQDIPLRVLAQATAGRVALRARRALRRTKPSRSTKRSSTKQSSTKRSSEK